MIEERPKPIPVIAGPTGSGKSELGIELALAVGGEIINCDSVQLYRGLNVGTNKVPMAARKGVPHHLIDVLEPTEFFTAGQYARLALDKVVEIETRGKMAIFVGGTGFYVRALRQPLFPSPATDLSLRERFKALQHRRGAAHLHRMLKRVDPVAAARINPNDWSRTIRALEFYFQTARPISAAQPNRPEPPEVARRMCMIALNPPRAAVYERINARTDRMFQAGWVEEVRALIASGVPDSAKAFNGHGYRRIVEFLRGEMSLDRAIELTKLDTRHYAKRQITWLRHEAGVTWFDGFGDDPQIQARVIEYVKNWCNLISA